MTAEQMGQQSSVTVAAFDVDGTLTRRDCVLPFLVRLVGRRRLIVVAGRHPLLLARTALGFGGRDRLKETVVGELLVGRPVEEVERVGRDFALGQAVEWLRPDTVGRLRWHREQGHEVVIVSASLWAYLRPLCAEVLGGVSGLLCTEIEVRPDGRCGARLVEGNCRGEEKARRLLRWIDGRPATIWAYGDSGGDAQLLALADHPVWVGRKPIAAHALEESS